MFYDATIVVVDICWLISETPSNVRTLCSTIIDNLPCFTGTNLPLCTIQQCKQQLALLHDTTRNHCFHGWCYPTAAVFYVSNLDRDRRLKFKDLFVYWSRHIPSDECL